MIRPLIVIALALAAQEPERPVLLAFTADKIKPVMLGPGITSVNLPAGYWIDVARTQPAPGVIVDCTAKGCVAYPDGSFVLYRTTPPKRPGPCSVGTGAMATDDAGYLYLCDVDGWRRSAAPMTLRW